MTEKMKAVVAVGGGEIEIQQVDKPEPGENEVRIKVKASSVCQSDKYAVEGVRPEAEFPRIPGHEVVGIIDEVGENIDNWSEGASGSKTSIECDALMFDDEATSDTEPYIELKEDDVEVAHEATVGKIGDEEIHYMMSRGIEEEEAKEMIVRGFIEPIAKELPLEYAVELNRLIQLEMEGSLG